LLKLAATSWNGTGFGLFCVSALLQALSIFLFGVALPARAQAIKPDAAEKQLEQLARALQEKDSAATYAKLSAFVAQHATDEFGSRAALALGHRDSAKNRFAQAERWLNKAKNDPILREYALYWGAQAHRALGRNAEALAQLESFRAGFPESVMTDQALQALAEAALTVRQPERAVAALRAYEKTATKPALLLRRAQALDQAGEKQAAAADFLALYYRLPLSDEAKSAGPQILQLEHALGAAFPAVPLELRLGRAAAFYDARLWREASEEYKKLLPQLFSADRERAELRFAQCHVRLGAEPGVLASLALTDPDLDGERLYALLQLHRAEKQESEMLAAVEQLATRYPQSRWTEEGLFAAGNYFWANLQRARAAEFYRRLLQQFPTGKDVPMAHWRLAWLAYLERRAEAATLLEEHLRRFPGSPATADALYWLGRATEHAGSLPEARSFYAKVIGRFPETYFAQKSAERLRVIGAGPPNSPGVLALIPSPAPPPLLEEAIPPTASEGWKRAQALRTIGFDASAELELRAAYAATSASRLLLDVARAALDAGRYAAAIGVVHLLYPNLEAFHSGQVPKEVWRMMFPLPFQAEIQRNAVRSRLDAMLVAGVIRQESTFEPDAISHAGAIGLMQVLPKTGRKMAHRLRLRYSRARLLQPEYNLRLGTVYLADLMEMLGSLEAALAAYNAGEDRVAAWQAERNFEAPAEFVESIPFTETREYVQTVIRNAEIYRRLYGRKP